MTTNCRSLDGRSLATSRRMVGLRPREAHPMAQEARSFSTAIIPTSSTGWLRPLGLVPPQIFASHEIIPLVGYGNAFSQIASLHREDIRLWREWSKHGEVAKLVRFVACVKNCLIAGDVAGSALPRRAGQGGA